jgi:hypothetical protein
MGRNRILIIGVLGLAAAAGAAWYIVSPGYAMSQLRAAAVEGDAEELEERIDFPAVRASLKERYRAELAGQIATADDGDGFAAFGSMIAMGMVDGMVEGFVNPASMAAMIQRGKMQGAQQESPAGRQSVEWSIVRDGLSRFSATPDAPEDERVPTMVFERDGLSWKLTEIEIPDGGLGASEIGR